MTVTAPAARDSRPPRLLIDVMNPVLRLVLRTPLGRLIPPVALLEFTGRSQRRFLIPIGWHQADTGSVVVTPAAWRANFRSGIPVTVHHRGQSSPYDATLDDDAERVAATLQVIADRRGSLRAVGIHVPDHHHLTAADVLATNRAVIRFDRRGP